MTVTEIHLGVPCTYEAQQEMLDKGYTLQPHAHGVHRQRYVIAARPGHYSTVEACMAAATRVFGFPRWQLVGRTQLRNIVRARQAAMWAACELGFSLPEIGRRLDRDHTTVLHGRDQCKNIQSRDTAYREACERVMSMVRSAS